MTREVKGILGFVSLTIIAITLPCFIFGFKTAPMAIGGLLTFAVMVAREVWQYKTKRAECFEWEDVVEYQKWRVYCKESAKEFFRLEEGGE